MVEILRNLSILLFIIQLFSTAMYNRQFFMNWLLNNSNVKNRWVNERDRFILALSIFFLFFSYFICTTISDVNENLAYLYSFLMLPVTLMVLLFHWTKFKIFQPTVRKRINSKKQVVLQEDFKLKKISEKDLCTLINKSYKDSFSSDLKDFKRIFIDREEDGEKLNCLDIVRSKRIGYSKIFELIHDLSENGILDLWDNDRKEFKRFVINNFLRKDKIIIEENLDSSYSKWLKKNR